MKAKGRVLVGTLVLLSIGGGAAVYLLRGRDKATPVALATVGRGDVRATVTCTGKIEAKKKVEILNRMVKRLVTDKDMPPEDSAEYELFRQKDAAAFDAVKEWLDAELKKAAGK